MPFSFVPMIPLKKVVNHIQDIFYLPDIPAPDYLIHSLYPPPAKTRLHNTADYVKRFLWDLIKLCPQKFPDHADILLYVLDLLLINKAFAIYLVRDLVNVVSDPVDLIGKILDI